MSAPLRLTAVLTHPVQYYAPWFRHIAAEHPEIDLTVLYATAPTPEQQGVGFGRAFAWDVPLTDGYRCRVIRPPRPGDDVHSDSFFGLDVPEIGEAVLSTRPDAVLLPGWHSAVLLRALRACRRAGIPLLYRGDSNLESRPAGWRGPVWEARTRFLLSRFDGHLAVGERARAYLRHFGAQRIFDSPHAVDNDFFARTAAPHQTGAGRAAARASFGLAEDSFVVLFAGKLEPKKRPLDLLRAAARLSGVEVLMVGQGELEEECRAEARRLGVRVSWAGFLNQSEIGRAYGAADCLALPSGAGETWGLVVNEALAAGLPCVVSEKAGCAPDLVAPGETGEVQPLGDAVALAAALERVRDRSAAGHDWAPACRRRAASYSFEAATAGLAAGVRAVSRRAESPRVIACCGGMVIVSGTERMTFEVLRVLRERGAAVHCIVNDWENHRIVPLADGIGASWSTASYQVRLDRRARSPLALARIAADVLATSRGLLREARRRRATHVLMPELLSVMRNAPALAWLRLRGVRVLLRLGNAPEPGPFYRRIWRFAVAPFVDRLVCNSSFTRQELLAHGIPAAKVDRVYNCVPWREAPVPSDSEDSRRDPGKIVYVGQIIPEKGVGLLLEAVGLLAAKGLGVRLDVIGDMDGWVPPEELGYRESLRARAAASDLAGRVAFLGWREDVPALLAAAAVHCCPSLPEIREGFGLVNLEAKLAGCPSVVFETGALPELIAHGEDGWICREVSAEALAEGLEHFLADPGRCERAGRAARASLDRFSRDRFAAAWWAVFEGTAGNETAELGRPERRQAEG